MHTPCTPVRACCAAAAHAGPLPPSHAAVRMPSSIVVRDRVAATAATARCAATPGQLVPPNLPPSLPAHRHEARAMVSTGGMRARCFAGGLPCGACCSGYAWSMQFATHLCHAKPARDAIRSVRYNCSRGNSRRCGEGCVRGQEELCCNMESLARRVKRTR